MPGAHPGHPLARLLLAGLALLLLLAACDGSRPSASPAVPARPADGKVLFGLMTPLGPYDMGQYDRAAQAAGKRPSLLLFPQGWAKDQPDVALLRRVTSRGVLPMIAWEPWDYQAAGTAARLQGAQPAYALRRIADGAFDDYVRRWAVALRDLHEPVALRFAHEMNGRWYPWAEEVNGNAPGDYVAAWRHVHDIFTRVGAGNVAWVWSPNILFPGSYPLPGLYPGDAYVDWIGIVGYDGGSTPGPAPAFDEVFGPTLAAVSRLSAKPIVITETGGTEASAHKPAWTANFFAGLAQHPEIRGFVWFDVDKEADWRFTSSEAARAAFAAGVAEDRYQAAPG